MTSRRRRQPAHSRPTSQRFARRRLSVLAALVGAAALVAGVLLASAPGGRPATGGKSEGSGGRSGGTHVLASHAKRKKHRAPRTFLGRWGVESTAIIAENRKPGTTAWRITATPASGSIAGFASTTYASEGEKVKLYVSTSAKRYHVVAYRMGYYQGKGGRQIWRSGPRTGVAQPACPLTPGINMVSCDNWAPSLTVRITSAWVPGDYLLKLVGTGGEQSYVLLTVGDPSSHAAYLVMARSLTEQGWNQYGGYSFYTGQGPCTLGQTGSYPQCNRARVVSFDRPYQTGDGASDFLGNEYPLVRFMEQHGLDVAYCTDITVDEHPSMLLHHRALLSLDHDETWTYAELKGTETALSHGVNLAFLGAAPLVRHARLQPSPLGPDREEVDYRNPAEDPLAASGSPDTVTGNTWATPPTGITVTPIVGSEYSGYVLTSVAPLPFVVYQATSWIFSGTGLHDGEAVPGVIHSDINHLRPGVEPADVEVLGHSPLPLADVYTNQGSWQGMTYADMTYYTEPQGKAGVFESGTVSWISQLNPCAPLAKDCTNLPVAEITGNLLAAMGQGPSGKAHPSVPNWQSVTPPGS